MKLEEAITESKSILLLEDDWDGEGGAKIEESTWLAATQFLTRLDAQVQRGIPIPNIGPGPDGSIDVFWQKANLSLLLNVEKIGRATFHGSKCRNNGERTVQVNGVILDLTIDHSGLFFWLMT